MENTMNSKSFRKKIFLIGLLALLGLLFQTGLFAQDDSNHKNLKLIHEKSFNVNPSESLKLRTDVGDVKVTSWDKNEVHVKVYGNKKAEEDLHYSFEKVSDGVEITAKKEGMNFFNIFKNYKLYYEISVPAKFNAYVSTAGGDVKVSDLEGYVKLATSGGDVDVAKIRGGLDLKTSGGDVEFAETTGDADVSTSGGDIKSTNHKGNVKASTSGGDVHLSVVDGRVQSSTSGGDVTLYYKGSNKGVSLSTSGGDIKVVLPENFAANADLSTSGGDVSCEITATKTKKVSSSKFIADLNGGGENLKCTTSGGDIAVGSN